jgi:glycosyltransferase involved in cell wall biosynthesis
VEASVIIPSYNSEATIEKCLESILGQAFPGEFEVIVVDSSSDKTPDIIRSRYPSVQCHHFDRKTDPGTARNFGVSLAQGEILLFIDSDCIARPGWLYRLVSLHRQVKYGIVGGAVENANPGSVVSLSSYVAEFGDCLPAMREGPTRHLPTCNISYKRRIFEKYGGFDPRYYPQEDYHFHWRLGKAGEEIYFDPDARVAHHHRTRWRSYFAHQRRIGQVTSRVLKVTDLPGSGFVHRPVVAAAVIPLLPLIKFTRTTVRFLLREPRPLLRKPLAVFVLFLGLFVWAVGFTQGVYSHQEQSSPGKPR